jgi:hypothetical protein
MNHSELSFGINVDWFLENPEIDFLCGICLDVLNEPRNCKNGHLYCAACLNAHLEHSNYCPHCRTFIIKRRLKKTENHTKIIDKIQNLRVKCDCDQHFHSAVCYTWGQRTLKECDNSYSGGIHFAKKPHLYKGISFRSLCTKKIDSCEICFQSC